MSYDSLRRNREYMGYGALTGLFRESQAQPPYTYCRNPERLREWQRSNAETSIQDEILKYISTMFNALQHVLIYKLTPKFNLLKSKCKSMTNHMDTASLCVIIFAIFTLFIILLSRFIVDYEDINNLRNTSNINNNINMNDDIITHSNNNNNDIIVKEYDTIDNLFRPTPIPLVDDIINNNNNINENIINRTTIFNEWVLINSINWKDIKINQIIKIKDIKGNKVSTAMIENINLLQMNIIITYINCWVFCHETIDIITSGHRMIYLIQNTIDINHKNNNTDSDTYTNDIEHEIENEIETFDPTQLYESIDKINSDHTEFKSWVETQFTEIQNNNDELKEVLTDYLDDKMNKLLQILENQQNTIESIQLHQQQQYNNNNNNNNINNTIDNAANINFDWDVIEDRIDNKIESVVKVQLEEKFGNLAQEIGQEIAKEIASQTIGNTNEINDDIIKGNDDGHDRKNNNENNNSIDWTYRVVSHSKLKINSNDIFHEYGYWIMHNLLSKWNQQSILPTYKPGDCTPLLYNKNKNALNSYITIELYKPIYIKQISLYHYHSQVLTQTAINAVPKEFQIWASFNLTKWYDLGNYTYNYYHKENTQYFDVRDMNEKKNKNYVDVTDINMESVEDDSDIVNDTSVITNNMYDDYHMGFKFIAFRLLSNYGGSDYACVYRLRVFGDIVS